MKNKLFTLPLLALAVAGLAACNEQEFKPIGGGETISGGGNQTFIPEPMEFCGYEVTTTPQDGGVYLLGLYQGNTREMCFMNGNPHMDGNEQYPFFFGANRYAYNATNKDILGDGAVQVLVTYTEVIDEKQNFTMKVIGNDNNKGHYYDDEYIYMYGATTSNTGSATVSIQTSPIIGKCVEMQTGEHTNRYVGYPDAKTYYDATANETFSFFMEEDAEGTGETYISGIITNQFNVNDSYPEAYPDNGYFGTYGSYPNIEGQASWQLDSAYPVRFYQPIAE